MKKLSPEDLKKLVQKREDYKTECSRFASYDAEDLAGRGIFLFIPTLADAVREYEEILKSKKPWPSISFTQIMMTCFLSVLWYGLYKAYVVDTLTWFHPTFLITCFATIAIFISWFKIIATRKEHRSFEAISSEMKYFKYFFAVILTQSDIVLIQYTSLNGFHEQILDLESLESFIFSEKITDEIGAEAHVEIMGTYEYISRCPVICEEAEGIDVAEELTPEVRIFLQAVRDKYKKKKVKPVFTVHSNNDF